MKSVFQDDGVVGILEGVKCFVSSQSDSLSWLAAGWGWESVGVGRLGLQARFSALMMSFRFLFSGSACRCCRAGGGKGSRMTLGKQAAKIGFGEGEVEVILPD